MFVLIAGISVGGFFTGKASIDLKKERSIAYETGYQDGNATGYSTGQSIDFYQASGTGASFASTNSVVGTPGLKFRTTNSVVTAMKTSSGWLVFGDLSA